MFDLNFVREDCSYFVVRCVVVLHRNRLLTVSTWSGLRRYHFGKDLFHLMPADATCGDQVTLGNRAVHVTQFCERAPHYARVT